jgi:hypothetical protein
MNLNRIIEGTITLVLVFLVLTNANGFDTVASAIGNLYSGAVKTLQGR